jgi:TRAP-type mannitol/chloroaromatic compound transport system substrate-binding protein
MKRRDFLKGAGVGALAVGASALSGCNRDEASATPAAARPQETFEWKMVTTWPKNFPGMGTSAEKLASLIGEMSGGRLTVRVFGGGELVPALDVFDTVSQGGVEMGHGAAYYWKSKSDVFPFFSTVPFGMNAEEMNAWLHYGGGLELWKEAYAPYGVIPAAAGNTGVQMAGWFNKEINHLEDLKGLKMRIPGLGGEVLKRAGGTPVNMAGGELFLAMQTGALDALEWVGPYNDLAFGLHKVAKYYYYPGWHEPGTTLEAIINQAAFDRLPADLQSIVINACRVVNQDMLNLYTARNHDALQTLVKEHGVDVRRLPDDVLERLRSLSEEVVGELVGNNEFARRVYDSYEGFYDQAVQWLTPLASRLSPLAQQMQMGGYNR